MAADKRVAFITGAGNGIGRSVAMKFNREGFHCVCVDKDELSVEATAALMPSGSVMNVQCDVSRADEFQGALQKAVDTYGRIDCCCNCAGIEGERARIHEADEQTFDHVMQTNAKGIWICMKYEIGQFLMQEPRAVTCNEARGNVANVRGSIVNISSTSGRTAMPEFGAYCASKWAVIGLTKTAAREYAREGIRVNVVCPATTDTPMVERFTERWPDWQEKTNSSYPVGRICSSEEVANAVYWMSSDSCVFLTGDALTVSGGSL